MLTELRSSTRKPKPTLATLPKQVPQIFSLLAQNSSADTELMVGPTSMIGVNMRIECGCWKYESEGQCPPNIVKDPKALKQARVERASVDNVICVANMDIQSVIALKETYIQVEMQV
ncbi:hypothetical protein ACE6H2_026295 [Prunus campanulata]